MAAIASSYRRPGGFTLTLQILGVIDGLLSLGDILIIVSTLAARRQMNEQALNLAVGGASVVLMLQILLRLVLLTVRALWTHRLVSNAGLFQRLPLSPLWAWAGFVTPVVCLWLPARMLLVLGNLGGRRSRILSVLSLAWSLARWLTCLTGAICVFVLLIGVGVYELLALHRKPDNAVLILNLELILAIAGTIGAILGIVVTTWTTRRQARPDQLHHAEVF